MKRLAAGIVVVAWMVGAAPAWAVDCDGLQEALDNAAPGSTVTLTFSGGLCPGNYQLPAGGITLSGEGVSGFRPGPGTVGRSLSGSSSGTTVIRHLLFMGPLDGHADAGGLQFDGQGTVTLDGNTFEGIRWAGDAHGGGAYLRMGGLAPQPAFRAASAGDAITVLDSTFTDNEVSGSGGGLAVVAESGSAELDGNTFTGNTAGLNGGGARVWANSSLVTGNTFSGNAANGETFFGSGRGGGLAVTSEAQDDDNSNDLRRIPADNTAADMDIARNKFTGNGAGAEGGGIYVAKNGDLNDVGERSSSGASPTVHSDRNRHDDNRTGVDDNSGDESGGGAHYEGVRVESVNDLYTRNTVPGNNACEGDCEAEGGGFSVHTGQRSANFIGVNTVAAGNSAGSESATAEGGGVYAGGGSFLGLTHATIAGNVLENPDEGDGIGASQGDTIAIGRSIVHGNTGADGDQDIEGTTSVTVDQSDVCDGTDPITGTGNICEDPLLVGPTRALGGDIHQTVDSPTWDTLAPIGQGEITFDFEDDPRPVTIAGNAATPYDMGADEFHPAEYGIAASGSPASITLGQTSTITVVVDNGGPNSAHGVTVTGTPGAPVSRAARALPEGCTGATTVECDLGVIAAGGSRTLTFSITPTSTGTVTSSFQVDGLTTDLTLDDHLASVSTVVTAPPPAPVVVPPQTIAVLPVARTCKSRRNFRIHVRTFRKDKVVSATIRVNGKLVKVVRGKRLRAPVTLVGLPKGTFKVTITARRRSGKTIRGTRTYRTCARKENAGRVPPL